MPILPDNERGRAERATLNRPLCDGRLIYGRTACA